MTNPLANLVAQAEASLADMSRRAVESVTVPIKAKSQELVADVTASVKASLVGLAVKAGLGLFATVMAMIALGYAMSALHSDLVERVGPMKATLIMAGAFLALAVIATVVMLVWPTKPARNPASDATRAVRQAEAAVARARIEAEAAVRQTRADTKAAARAEAPAGDPMGDMKSGLGAIASALGEAGFRREQAGLRAGLAIAEQLKPMQLVSLALLGGFLAGVRQRRRG